MEIQYFKSAWGDIKNSPGWFGKVCLLALVNFIPVFGQIVTFGYLYGWAREIAWGTHEPMPEKIFDNDDGKFWRRGWFTLVLTFVFALVPYLVIQLGSYWQGFGFSYSFFQGQTVNNPLLVGFGGLLMLVGWVAYIVCFVLAWIGNMRVSIYDRLSSGFQLGKIWKMLRHDTNGILRVFGMYLLFSVILGFVISIVCFILVFLVIAVGVAGLINAGYSPDMIQYMSGSQSLQVLAQFIAAAGLVGVLAVLVFLFLAFAASVFVDMLVIRAMGYWTMKFDVPQWGGQDDPMPFELFEAKPVSQPVQSAQAAQPVQPVQPASPVQPVQPVQPAAVPAPVSVEPVSADAPTEPAPSDVTYDKSVTVGASFIMTPEQIDELEAEVQAQAIETTAAEETSSTLDAQGAHGVEDGQASDPDVGEDGEPHVGQSEGGESQN